MADASPENFPGKADFLNKCIQACFQRGGGTILVHSQSDPEMKREPLYSIFVPGPVVGDDEHVG